MSVIVNFVFSGFFGDCHVFPFAVSVCVLDLDYSIAS